MNGIFGQQAQPEKRKIFVSFHHADQAYRDEFDKRFGDAFISMSVDYGDIDSENSTDYIKRLIQEDHIIHSSVVVALYGAQTRNRKHVDWEISAGLSEKVGGRKGLVVILLPGFQASPFTEWGAYDESRVYPHLHPRTATNLKNGYGKLYYWPGLYTHPSIVDHQINTVLEEAVSRRDSLADIVDNSHPQYERNLA
ncbi:MAG: TIR domain-containing protein [Patescibacteria group bacterium]|nr:TIR domain-containing protein [Patescibacteria group bacterium]